MTYCVGLLVDTGLVMLSDSRTNAGVDQINTFRKMATFQRANDRVLVLLSAGNLAITQAVVNLLHEPPEDPEQPVRIYRAANMFNAARVVGDALREIHARDAESLKEQGHEFNGTFILGGQIKGEEPRLFHIYSAGNFIESSIDTPYFQIGESKYGKPINRPGLYPAAAASRQPRSAPSCPWIPPYGQPCRSGLRWIWPSCGAMNSSSPPTSASIWRTNISP